MPTSPEKRFLTSRRITGWTVCGVLAILGAGLGVVHASAPNTQALRDAIADGGEVWLAPGTYVLDEPLVIDRQVQFTAAPGAVLIGNWDRYGEGHPTGIEFAGTWNAVVRVLTGADGSVLRGLSIDGQGKKLHGIQIGAYEEVGEDSYAWIGPHDVEISNMHVTDTGEYGIFVIGGDRAVIRDSLVERTQLDEESGQGGAIRVSRSDDSLIERVRIREVGGKGIAAGTTRRLTVRDSTVYQTLRLAGDGIYFGYNAHDGLVSGCRVFDPAGNAFKSSRRSSGVTIENSVFIKHNRGVGNAFRIQGGRDNTIRDNIIVAHGSGSSISVSDHPHETQGGPAVDNVFLNNQVVNPSGNYLGDSGTGTIYTGNVESARPLQSWMDAAGLNLLGTVNLSADYVHFDGSGFEGSRVGWKPGEFDAVYGRWQSFANDVSVVDAATAGFHAHEGDRFLRMRGGGSVATRPELWSFFNTSGSVGDQTRTRFAFRVDEGCLRLRLRGDGDNSFADVLFYADGSIRAYDTTGLVTLALTHDPGAWNTATIDYVLGASETFLSVNGGTAVLAGPRAVATALWNLHAFGETTTPLLAYMDAARATTRHVLSYTSGAGGALEGGTAQIVVGGGVGAAVKALPDAGAVFDSWSDGVTANPRAEDGVAGDVEAAARFRSLGGVAIDWYADHGLTPGTGDDWSDLDGQDPAGKGTTLLAEYIADTDPHDILSRLRATGVIPGPPPEITFVPSSQQRMYRLQYTEDLRSGIWSDVPGQTPRPGTGAWDALSDPEFLSGPRFYRIKVTLP